MVELDKNKWLSSDTFEFRKDKDGNHLAIRSEIPIDKTDKEITCNECGGKMKFHKDESILIPVGNNKTILEEDMKTSFQFPELCSEILKELEREKDEVGNIWQNQPEICLSLKRFPKDKKMFFENFGSMMFRDFEDKTPPKRLKIDFSNLEEDETVQVYMFFSEEMIDWISRERVKKAINLAVQKATETIANEIFDELENNKFIDLRNRGEGIYAKIMSLKQKFVRGEENE